MRSFVRAILAIVAVGVVALALAAWSRVARVTRAAAAVPVYPGAREGGGRTRYWPHLLSWDDRSSARVQRVFAFPQATSLTTIGRHADATLAPQGWYLVTPEDLERITNPQVIVWQRDPDERLDLSQLWPLVGMTRDQRLYGGIFPAEFLDAPLVIEWSWALGGPRSPRPAALPGPSILLPPPPRPPNP
ncbi:MAG: hypothetical protein M3O61_10285 [Gemmatimonadota bacterium]|nr:hypothetical protein [Gemmatimonadota bacterium]